MPLMSEGKPGPKPAKLREIWRREKRGRDQTVANMAAKTARGLPVGDLLADLLRMQDDRIAGRYDGRSSAAKILGELHHCRAVEPGFDDSFGVHRCKTEFRARIVRERPNQGYARNLGGGAWPGEGY